MMIFKQLPLVLCLSVVASLLSGCGDDEIDEAPLRPVRFMEASLTGANQALSFAGSSHAGLESKVSFKVSGTVKGKHVKVGDRVEKGELLFSLDPRDYQISVQQAEATLASARATQRNAKANYERVRLLYENNNASLNDLDSARANADSADANVKAASKQLESARNQLAYTKLYAPANCAVAATYVRENENVSPGQQVAQLNCGDTPEVKISVPEAYIAQVKVGDSVSVKFDAIPDTLFEATVTEVGVSAEAGTAFPVTVKMQKKIERLRAGMAAEVVLNLTNGNQGREVIYVPSHAVSEDASGRFVFIVVNSEEAGVGIVKRMPVELGELTSSGMEILSGLSTGDRVITAGVTFLADGQRVRLHLAGEE